MNDSEDLDVELQELLSELLDGSLDQDARHRLNERLSNDPRAQDIYLDFCEAHATLAWEHGLVVADISPSTRAHSSTTGAGLSWTRVSAIIATLAASLLLAVMWWNSDDGISGNDGRGRPTNVGPVVAQLISRIDAVVTADSVSWEADEIRVGEYQVERGLIQLQFPTGVIVFIEAPAAFQAISERRIAVHSGRISANVPPEGTGFTVVTPEADVIDFGTEFSIEVGVGESEVHVFEGHVQVKPRPDNVQQPGKSINLRTEQAIRIAESTRQPVGIDLANDRFIRSIEEPQKAYPRLVKQLDPVAYYRMPIKERGLACHASKYDGQILTGAGSRPACAPGIIGGSLRVGGKSIGRGGVVKNAPRLRSDRFSMSCWIFATGRPKGATIVSDMKEQQVHFSLSLDQGTGTLVATVRDAQEQSIQCSDVKRLPLEKWHHVTLTSDGRELMLYRNGKVVSSVACSSTGNSPASSLWIGVDHEGTGLWEGRIDELALFNKTLSPGQITALYEASPPQ